VLLEGHWTYWTSPNLAYLIFCNRQYLPRCARVLDRFEVLFGCCAKEPERKDL
jgi:hypothetical protein